MNRPIVLPCTYCSNNPIIYYDPTGHAVTEWDTAHLTGTEIAQLANLTEEWNSARASGDTAAMAAAAAAAAGIRDDHLVANEAQLSNGIVYNTDTGEVETNYVWVGSGEDIVEVQYPVVDIGSASDKYDYLELMIDKYESITEDNEEGTISTEIQPCSYKASDEVDTGTSSSLYINDVNISNYRVISDSQFGSLRNLVKAYGGSIITMSSHEYKVCIGTFTFEIDINSVGIGQIKSVMVKDESKWLFKSQGTLDYSASRNSDNEIELIVDIQQFVDIMQKQGLDSVIKYKLGENGGIWANNNLAAYQVGYTQSVIIPGDAAEDYYNSHKNLGDFFGFVGEPGDIIGNPLDEALGRYRNNAILANGAKYYQFATLRIYHIADGIGIIYENKNYIFEINGDYYEVTGSDIGEFILY